MRWLLWKDFRLARPLFVVAVLLVALPHAVALGTAWSASPPMRGGSLFTLLHDSAIVGLVLSPLPLLFWGGLAMAGERGDRSAEFLNCQPVSRGRILLSKLLVTLVLFAVIWLPNLLFCEWFWYWRPGELRDLEVLALFDLTVFSTAWFFSARLESPVFAACAGLLVLLLLTFGNAILMVHFRVPESELFVMSFVLWPSLAVLSLVAGTVHYLRRVEP